MSIASQVDVGQATILVVLENELVRRGLLSMLSAVPSVREARRTGSADEASALLTEHRPDVLLCRGNDRNSSALAVTAAERGARILLLLEDLDLEAVDESIMLLAHGFLLEHEVTVGVLGEALERLSTGEISLPAGLARILLTRAHSPGSARGTRGVCLTPREQEVLSFLAQGLSNKQIARRLTISEHGVKRHVTNLLAKLNCPNRTLAVALALQEGLILAVSGGG
ncbi:LuxR C-terminal-related transcriptional regulator [Streptomyces tailanensis]|uniref:LuxR C-terminal-related transcriptional regulator n=1 Tax=Streptomyces tailanensis TaxID=2569858 RepID=UPI00122E8DF8|nr:response regulator transcription factor [Streptomyces tailanensis]